MSSSLGTQRWESQKRGPLAAKPFVRSDSAAAQEMALRLRARSGPRAMVRSPDLIEALRGF